MSQISQLNEVLSLIASIVTIVAITYQLIVWMKKIAASRSRGAVAGPLRMYLALFLGLFAALGHGLLWTFSEKLFVWHFGGGGGSALPTGWEAVVLSLTMTIPLTIIFPVFQKISGKKIVPPYHWTACAWVVLCAALSHLLLYGTQIPFFPGLKALIFPIGSQADLARALFMEFVYAVLHSASIVLVYQVFAHTRRPTINLEPAKKAVISGSLFFLGAMFYIIVRYPESLTAPTWIEVRGVLNATVLMVILTGGMLM